MAITTPYGNPNWLKRQMRLNTPRPPEEAATNDPRAMATGMFNAGMQLDQRGGVRPTRDFGSLLRLNSSQMNPLSRGVKPGSFSSLGQPANSMYANNPGFFNRDSGVSFAQMIQQRNQGMTREQNIAQAQQAGTFGGIRDKYNLEAKRFGKQMDESGNITALSPYRPDFSGTTTQAQTENASKLKDRAAGLKLLREMSRPKVTEVGGGKNIEGKYGTGWSAPITPGKKNEGMIDRQPVSETMTGLANKQVREGTWRKGDRLPEGMTEEQALVETEKARQNILSRQRTRK